MTDKPLMILELNHFANLCGYFHNAVLTDDVNVNNGYNCRHEDQEEIVIDDDTGKQIGCCYARTCPLGYKPDGEVLVSYGVLTCEDLNGQGEYDGDYIVITDESAIARLQELGIEGLSKQVDQKFYYITLPIGDFSCDGHGVTEEIPAISNVPVERLREIHRNIPSQTGIDITAFCNGFEDDIVPAGIAMKLDGLGWNTQVLQQDEKGFHVPDAFVMADLWAFLLCSADKDLRLSLLEVDECPSLLVSGVQGMRSVGYGLFRSN